jgi:thymidine kinase
MSTSENNQIKTNGYIEVICGSMFSGKTKELICRLENAQQNNQRVVCFKPDIDTRYDKSSIVSHDNKKFKSISIKKSEEVCSHIANSGKKIIVAGLDMDYLGRPFNFMPRIMALSEKVTKLHAKCDDCSAQGNHTFRKNKSEKLVQIGEKTDYLALCRRCFNKRIKKNE